MPDTYTPPCIVWCVAFLWGVTPASKSCAKGPPVQTSLRVPPCLLTGASQMMMDAMKAENEKLAAAGGGEEENARLEEMLAAKQAELMVHVNSCASKACC